MNSDTMQLRLGAATVTVIHDGDWLDPRPWAEFMDVPAEKWRPRYAELFTSPFHLPCYCYHIALGSVSLVVDTGFGNEPFHSARVSVRRTAGLLAGLAKSGVQPGDVSHVVITHAHLDHFAGLTERRGVEFVPAFPRATCYLGREDWVGNPERDKPGSPLHRTFGVLERLGRLVLVAGEQELAPGLSIVPSPGETPGHSSVRVESAGQVLWLVGDLYHHPVEAAEPAWAPRGRDQGALLRSRQALARRAAAENALVLAGHIPGAARLVPAGASARWQPAG